MPASFTSSTLSNWSLIHNDFNSPRQSQVPLSPPITTHPGTLLTDGGRRERERKGGDSEKEEEGEEEGVIEKRRKRERGRGRDHGGRLKMIKKGDGENIMNDQTEYKFKKGS